MRWEYMVEMIDFGRHRRSLNDPDRVDLVSEGQVRLNVLGDDDWELCAAEPRGLKTRCIFKRPVGIVNVWPQ